MEIMVIGAGAWGKNLIRNFYELGVLSIICDIDASVFTPLRQRYKDIYFTTDYKSGLYSKGIDAVVVASSADMHYKLAKEVLLAKKDVFVEKPLALNLFEGEELVRLAHQRELILMVGHILHYHPAVIKLKELIRRGELGKIQYIYSNRLNIGKIRTEENIFWSFAPHDISLILSIAGEISEEIYVHGAKYLQPNVEDVTLSYLKFKNGINAHIFVSWLNPFKEQKFVVIGDKKMAVFDDIMEDRKLVLYPHRINWVDGKVPIAEKAEAEIVPIPKEEPLKNECRHFLDCIKTRKRPLTDGNEALQVLKVLTALSRT